MAEPYYRDEHVTLWHGDALDVLRTLPDESVGVGITDPPYSAHVHGSSRSGRMRSANDRGGRYGADTRRNVDLGFAHLTADLRTGLSLQFARLVRRWTLVFSDLESCHLWRADLESAGLQYVRTAVWRKIGATPQFSGDRPAVGVETITCVHQPGRKRWNGGGRHGVFEHPIVPDRARAGHGRNHTTEKPLSLMGELVSLFSEPGDTVLDATAGSGTTLVAAKQAGRRAIGVELEERYCEIAARRLSQGVLDFEAGA